MTSFGYNVLGFGSGGATTSAEYNIDTLVIAGGGSACTSSGGNGWGMGGGGAGGLLAATGLEVSSGTDYIVTVGAAGTKAADSNNGSNPRKVFFKLFSNVLGKVHITCGLDLKETWDNLKQAHDEIPKLTCKPLFYFTDDHYEILGQTFFDGIPIDSSLEEGILNEESVHEILGSIQSTFVTMVENSSKEKLLEELKRTIYEEKKIILEINKPGNYIELEREVIFDIQTK